MNSPLAGTARGRIAFVAGLVRLTVRSAGAAVLPALGAVALIVALVVGGWGLAHAATRGVNRLSPTWAPATLRGERGQFRWFNCIEQQLHQVVPRHAVVFVAQDDSASHMRLTELASPWARVTTSRDRAQYAITLAAGPGKADCGGSTVAVSPP